MVRAPIVHAKGQVAILLLLILTLLGCGEEPALDESRAESIIRSRLFERQPVYAEVPMTVRWSPDSPKDEFDVLSLATLEKLEEAGLVTTETSHPEEGGTVVSAETTERGVRELGTVPSPRGPALRGRIAEKVIDRIQSFERHPERPLVGRAEVVWHYENPTDLYPLFETRRDKPLGTPFKSIVSLSRTDRGWIVETTVPKLPLD
ncbi:MAG: hypothetical protein R3338_09460 [Thermoanaerobaculia bacterium]|nr:hypothetical protein [Thermoanaerobaculia bacterium]